MKDESEGGGKRSRLSAEAGGRFDGALACIGREVGV